VFGGYDNSYRNDVRVLSLSGSPAWALLLPRGPRRLPASSHAAIYDPVRDRMVVFGGYDGAYRDDLWALSLAGDGPWNEVIPPGNLLPRAPASSDLRPGTRSHGCVRRIPE